MRALTLKENNLIEGLRTAVEQRDDCNGMDEGSKDKCKDCIRRIFYYDSVHG